MKIQKEKAAGRWPSLAHGKVELPMIKQRKRLVLIVQRF
jgi:hypothetical protein